jgi:hypothetical protein
MALAPGASSASNLYRGATEIEISTDSDEVGPVPGLALAAFAGIRIEIARSTAVGLPRRAGAGDGRRSPNKASAPAANWHCLPWSFLCHMATGSGLTCQRFVALASVTEQSAVLPGLLFLPPASPG